MQFKKYQHLERFGTTEVKDINIGECYIFPKIDGTNASIWIENGEIQSGSRNRHLDVGEDNAGFREWVKTQENIKTFLKANPNSRLYGEWLVPHTLKTYTEDSWRKLYVFDVAYGDIENSYMHYEDYSVILDDYKIDYIPPICKVLNPTYDRLIGQLEKNTYLIEDGEGCGEGIVIKNYDFKNRFGRTTWAKIVRNEFKVKNQKVHGVAEIKEKKCIEESIVREFVTESLVQKEFSKIESESGWSSSMIPRLLGIVYYCLITEECWNFVKKYKDPSIDFKFLKQLTTQRIKEYKPELF